jgi:3-deoxy-D-manno-octulosonate 8-phosphate phosphatase (KDO 8-P phosphatase)
VDVDIFKRTGLAVAVADADPAVKPYVDMVTKTAGGRGAVREFINLILKCQGKLHTS